MFANKWIQMPNMIYSHDEHCLVTVKDKLFVIGYENNKFEVFDNVCKKFVFLTHLPRITCSKCWPTGKKLFFLKNTVHR